MSFNEELSNTVRESFCSALEGINNFNDWFSRLPFGSTNLTRSVARTAYRNLCNREPPNEPDPPFTGGQCSDVQYDITQNVEGAYYWKGSNQIATYGGVIATGRFYGPITSIRILTNEEAWSNGASGFRVQCTHRDGTSFLDGSGSSSTSWEFRLTSSDAPVVTRVDGLPDSCGDPPPVLPEPTPGYNTQNTTVNYNDYSNNSVAVDVNITFGSPQLTIDGDINIPVRILSPDINIPISGNLSINNPEFNFNFGDSNYSSNDSSDGSDYDSPDDTPECPPDIPNPVQPTDPTNPDVETRRTIRGVIITVTEYPPDFGFLFQDGNPDIPLPNFGYISFFCQVGSNAAWTIDLPVKNRRNLIECPWTGGAIAVEGTPRPGVTWVLSEVYAVEQDLVTFEV